MTNNYKAPFPQADDFNKIISIVNMENVINFKDKDKIRHVIGDLTDRQIQYYLSACMYLGVIDEFKEITELGRKIRTMTIVDQEIELAKCIISNDVFGYVFFLQKKLNIKLTRDEIIDIMKQYVSFESEEVYKRRAQTIIKWLEWIKITFENN